MTEEQVRTFRQLDKQLSNEKDRLAQVESLLVLIDEDITLIKKPRMNQIIEMYRDGIKQLIKNDCAAIKKNINSINRQIDEL